MNVFFLFFSQHEHLVTHGLYLFSYRNNPRSLYYSEYEYFDSSTKLLETLLLWDVTLPVTVRYNCAPFKRELFLLPNSSHSILKCPRRSLVIRNAWFIAREHQIVKICCQISSIFICHHPHCPDYASESTVVNRCSEVESLIGDASFCQLCCVTSREECKLSRRESGSHNVKESKAIALVKSE